MVKRQHIQYSASYITILTACMLASPVAAQSITIAEGETRSETVSSGDPDARITNSGTITGGVPAFSHPAPARASPMRRAAP